MRGHVRKRGRKWAVVLDNGTRINEAGRPVRRQKWVSGFRTKDEAEDALAVLLVRKMKGEVIDPDKTPFADYLVEWLKGRADELAALSVTQYRSVIKNHVAGTTLGTTPLGAIRRPLIREHEQLLKDKGLALSTRNVVRAVISRAFADAVEDNLIDRNPADGGRRASEAKQASKFTVWTPDELRAFLLATADDRLAALWRLAVATGARRGELLGCTWFGYSSERSTIEIAQQVVPTRGGASIAECKTKGSHRTIRIDSETVAALERHKVTQIAEKDLAGDAYVDRDLIFADELGAPINPQRITEAFASFRVAAKIRPGRLHDLRHTHGSTLLAEGVPVHIVSARLGHSSPMVTLSVYAHVLPRSDERAAEIMAGVLG